jgi:S-adenosylmethionine uptake transporter
VRRGRSFLDGLSPLRRGALIYVIAGLVFIVGDSLVKTLVADVPVVHVVLGRNATYLAAVILLAGRRKPRRLLATARPGLQLARGLAMFATTATWFFALSLLPLAEVSTLSSTTPFIVVALAGPLLGERITRSAVAGTILGFAGVVVMVGFDAGRVDAAILVPLANATIFALFGLLTRSLRSEPAEVTLFFSGLVPMLAGIALFMLVPTTGAPSPGQWLAIGVVGLVTLTGHRLLVAAYRWGRASDLAPLGYLSLLWAFLVGAIVFGEPIQLQALVGAAAIALGGAAVLRSAVPGEEPAQALGDYGGPVEAEAEAAAEAEIDADEARA